MPGDKYPLLGVLLALMPTGSSRSLQRRHDITCLMLWTNQQRSRTTHVGFVCCYQGRVMYICPRNTAQILASIPFVSHGRKELWETTLCKTNMLANLSIRPAQQS